jgi:hypothetical protein
MNRYYLGMAGMTSCLAVLTACAVIGLCPPQPSFAAERTVLCEEFTSIT